jgi:hypothetical protein
LNEYVRIEEYIAADLLSNLKALTLHVIIPSGYLMSVVAVLLQIAAVTPNSFT